VTTGATHKADGDAHAKTPSPCKAKPAQESSPEDPKTKKRPLPDGNSGEQDSPSNKKGRNAQGENKSLPECPVCELPRLPKQVGNCCKHCLGLIREEYGHQAYKSVLSDPDQKELVKTKSAALRSETGSAPGTVSVPSSGNNKPCCAGQCVELAKHLETLVARLEAALTKFQPEG